MMNLERTEKEMWDRHKDGQDADQISRAMRIPYRAVANFLEERKILGPPQDKPSKQKSKKMTSQPTG